ncbi:IclR family transcriptional regulator [Yoonia maricola]|uniref:IclR family transcriptional regulator n=1 Tax=Yoonia maricola TaxID=420999 RepID=A0A2M8W5I3_9RHOB|nr:IclR family transcriptional regulator [Yoonia maricola]PJI86168.1 IclR family transcriptional regulator [Yoonia maricola]
MDGNKVINNQRIKVISRATDILRVLGRETSGLSLGQIANQVELPRSTVQRIVAALALEGFISIEKGNAGIRLGPEIQSLAQASAAAIRDRLRPLMKQISELTGETVDLAVLEGHRMRFIDQIVGSQRLRTVSSIGETFPLTTTANGKAALACLDPVEADKLIIAEFEERPALAPRLPDFFAEIEAIRSGALARDINEHTEGVSALGFAISEPGSDVYAISIPVPSSRFERKAAELATSLEAFRAGYMS